MTGHPPEQHSREQYYFDKRTRNWLAQPVMPHKNPCLLDVPSMARELRNRRLLDIDERFADLVGFIKCDVYKPTTLAERFDLIVCDPPFHSGRSDPYGGEAAQALHHSPGRDPRNATR